MGLQLASKAGQRGLQVTWVGHHTHCDLAARPISAQIKPQFLEGRKEDLNEETDAIVNNSVVSM